MYLSLWSVKINSRTETLATETPDVEQAIPLIKEYWKKEYPDEKAFNIYRIERVTGVELLKEEDK